MFFKTNYFFFIRFILNLNGGIYVEYYILLEKLIRDLNSEKELTPDKIRKIFSEICKYVRISRVMASYYEDVKHEQMGRGEIYCCFDSGTECEEKVVLNKGNTAQPPATAFAAHLLADFPSYCIETP